MADDFGTHLKRQREQRGISLEEITTITKIHTRYLKALEDNQFDDLPGEVFIKGFIRSYGRAIGANVNELLSTYDETVGKERVEKRQNETQEDESETKKQVFLVNALVGGFLGLFFLFAVWYLVSNPPQSQTPEDARKAVPQAVSPKKGEPEPAGTLIRETEDPPQEESAAEDDEKEVPEEEKSVENKEVKAESGTENNATSTEEKPGKPDPKTGQEEKPVSEKENSGIMADQKAQQVQEDRSTPAETAEVEAPLNLVIQVTENAWFNISIDSSEERDFILPAGETKEFKAQEGFLLTIGNRRGTSLKLNGKVLELPVSSDNVVRRFKVNAKTIE